MTTILRPSRALFRFSGADAQKLLNDVVTGRIKEEAGAAKWWALLSPQGKIQAEGLASWEDGAFWLDVHRDAADAFHRKMRMYKLRAALEIEDLRESHVVGWTDAGEGPGVANLDPREVGSRFVAERGASGLPEDEAPFVEARVKRGVSEQGPDFAADTTFPHDIGMDLLEGIDFKKGCYVGQEVVSRMQHRGTARRRPAIVSGLPEGATAGAKLLVGDREIGEIGTASDGKAVAVVRLDRVTDPAGVTLGGLPVTLDLPAWATYQFGESAGAE
jgi:folate-binding protein YgfZ